MNREAAANTNRPKFMRSGLAEPSDEARNQMVQVQDARRKQMSACHGRRFVGAAMQDLSTFISEFEGFSGLFCLWPGFRTGDKYKSANHHFESKVRIRPDHVLCSTAAPLACECPRPDHWQVVPRARMGFSAEVGKLPGRSLG